MLKPDYFINIIHYMKILTLFLLTLFTAPLSSARELCEITSSGSIIAGIRKISYATYTGNNQEDKGFCYDLANEFANSLNVSLEIKIVRSIPDYWKHTKRGHKTPDIFESVDVIADIITVTDRRKELVNMIPFVENTEIFFGRKDLTVKTYNDLRGLRIITNEAFSFYDILKNELKINHVPFIENHVAMDDKSGNLIFPEGRKPVPEDYAELLIFSKNTGQPNLTAYYQIILKNADVGIQDSFTFFVHNHLTLAFRKKVKSLFPLRKPSIGALAFCTSKETPELTKKLSQFMRYFRRTDTFNSLFIKYADITYDEYKAIIYNEAGGSNAF